MKTETIQPFSFTGKTVTVVGGKGKMGNAFATGLQGVGANIQIVDRDTAPLGKSPATDALLFAANERVTLGLIGQLSEEVRKTVPIITTSSTNGLIAREAEKIGCLVPIHALSGPSMKGAVMIDCTEEGMFARNISTEIARIIQMEQEFVPLEEHDREIALKQVQFHQRVWEFIDRTNDLQEWTRRLPVSQRRAAIGDMRVLIRPDISAELISAFLKRGSINRVFGQEFIFGSEDESPSEHSKSGILQAELLRIIQERDPDGLIRAWVKTENERMDQGVPGGPRSFQAFLRDKS